MPLERWQVILARARLHGSFLGVDEQAFPRDFATFAYYYDAVQQIPDRYPLPDAVPLEQGKEFLHQTATRYAATWCEYTPA